MVETNSTHFSRIRWDMILKIFTSQNCSRTTHGFDVRIFVMTLSSFS
ncbi:hypothetical protein SLEP1_g13741 [Rubroshorea leprosula]|uniref:Uncharacterized protein n=1 Tax=Rubroshorea leprosula TaxID=152421 RepID=A0AAV5ISH0_9ROSI|nr:hypothetical protein SLEP1_g13741 [Rubroshorea leprosula]